MPEFHDNSLNVQCVDSVRRNNFFVHLEIHVRKQVSCFHRHFPILPMEEPPSTTGWSESQPRRAGMQAVTHEESCNLPALPHQPAQNNRLLRHFVREWHGKEIVILLLRWQTTICHQNLTNNSIWRNTSDKCLITALTMNGLPPQPWDKITRPVHNSRDQGGISHS